MICSSKENSINYLFNNGAIDSIRKVTDFDKFDEFTDKLTKLAETKYGLDTMGAKLFAINYESKKFMDSPYYRESNYTVPRAMPNEVLFEQLDMLIDQYESRTGEDQPMMMKAPSVDAFTTEKEDFLKSSEEMGLPVFEYDLSTLQNARTKEIATILAARLALTLKTNYLNITEEEARNLLKNSPIPYQGEPAFFFAGTVYTVGENVNLNTVLHEFSHPLLQGIRKEKPALFKNLYAQLGGTTEGQQIIDYVEKAYPELSKGSDRFMEEALAHALQLSAVNKVTNTVETEGFAAFIKNLLFQFRELFRKTFGNKKAIKDINVNTTIDELADMLLEKDFEFETESVSNEDAAMFARFVKARAKLLTDNASTKGITEAINNIYATNNIINERAKNFKSDAKTRAIVKESLLLEGTTQLTPGVKKSLQGFQTIIKGKNQTVDEIIDDALDAESLRLKDLNNRSIALVTSLEVTNNITKLITKELEKLQKKTNFGSPSDIALLGLYKSSLTRWYQSISDVDTILKEDFALATDNAFSQLLGEITRNTIRGQEIITNLYKTHSVQFFVEITGYMSDFVKGELRTDLGNALKGTLTEQEFENLYNKIVQQKIEDSDIEALTAKGIEPKYINDFIERYNYFIINENKIQDILEGKFKDVSVFNRFLESYSSSNSPIVGSLSIYIENQKRQAEQKMWMKSLAFRKKLENLLPQVSEFSKWNTRAMLDLLAEKDSIAHFNRKTGKMEKKEVYTFLDEYGNGWRYDLDMLEFAVEEARNKGDVDGLKAAMKALRTFNIEYMNSEYVPEYYEKDAIFDSSPIAQEAWLDRKLALDEISAETNSLQNELERFDNYTTVDAAWDNYKQLYSLTYPDGTPKRDSPENESFDLSKTLILREHRNLTKDFHEFIPVPGSLQTAYTEIINLWTSQGLKDDEINVKLKEWIKQNTRLVYTDKYYEENNRLRTRLAELQEKANEALDSEYDISAGYKRISDLIYGFKDEQGQPDPTALGVDKLKIIKDTQQEINDYRFAFDTSSGLSRTELEELKTYSDSLKIRKLTADEEARYMLLVTKQANKGLTIEELAEMQGIFDELGDLSMKLATEYYLDTLNFNLSRFNMKAVTDATVNDFINTPDFLAAVESDRNFYEWFLLNHVTRKVWDKTAKRYVDKFERTSANSVTIPKDPTMILTTEILDPRTNAPVEILGVPNAKHSIFTVKNKYRTIPFGITAEEKKKYIGKIIDNRGNFLPKPYDGTSKGAKTDKYVNKKYQALKKSGGAAYQLLEEVKKYHLENQEGKASMTKLYLDMPRYAIDSVVEAFQAGNYGQRFSQIKSNVGEFFKQTFSKSVVDVENGFNYDAENNLVNTDVNGEQISYIPVSGLYNLDAEKVSPDVFQGLMTYALSLETHGVLLENLPLVESLIDSLSTPEAQPKNLNKNRKDLYKAKGILEAVTMKGTNQMLGQVKSLFEKEFFGVYNSDISEKYPKISKLLGAMQKASTLSALAVNIPSDLKNKYGAMIQMVIEASGAEFINTKDLALGRAWAFKSMLNWSSKKGIYAVGPPAFTTQMIEMFDPVFKTTDEMGRSVSRSLFTDLINGEWMFMHRKFGEMEVGLTLFGSFLNAQKVDRVMPDGKTQSIKYMDAWELDSEGIIKLKSGIDPKWNNLHVNHTYAKGETLEQIAKQYGISVEDLKAKNRISSTLELADGDKIIIAKSEAFDMFRNRVQGVSRALFGAYDKFGQPEGNKLALYRLYFFMRKWFTPMFVNRFGGEAVFEEGKFIPKIRSRYDWATGTTRKGYYITAFQSMVKMLSSRGKSIKYLEEKEKIALKKASSEAMFIIVFALMATLLFGYDDDDEDKWKKISGRSEAFGTDGYKAYGFIQNHMLNLLMGVNAETTAFIPIPKIAGLNLGMDDYGKMLTSTSTAFGNTFLLYMEIIGDVLNMLTFNDAAKYQRDSGPYSWEQKDDYKIINNIMKAFGITGSTGDPETTTKNLRMSASRIGN